MRPTSVSAIGPIALMLSLTGTDAFAKGMVTAPLADYNSAQVLAAGGNVTVPFGAILANAVYTVAAGTQLEVGSSFTITLPSGFQFTSLPSVTGPGSTTFPFLSGGIGSNSVTFKVSTTSVPAGGTVSIGSFSVSGATALEGQFGGNALSMTFQATNNVNAGNNDNAPIPVPVFTHAVGSLPDTITPGSGQINLASTPPGTQFVPNGATIATSGLVATFAINTELNDPFNSNAPVLKANGLANTLNSSDTVTITVQGKFTGIATAYASPTVTTCASGVPGGAITGTVTSTSLTFTGVTINTPMQICMVPDGVTLMQEMTTPFIYTYSAGTSTDFFGGLSQTTAGNFYTYNGSLLQEILYTGIFSPYPMYIRIVNDGTPEVNVLAAVKADNGSTGYAAVSVPGNTNQLVPVSTFIENSGVTLDSTHRASIMFLTVPAANVKISQLLLDPNGILVPLGSGSSP